jgi:hypothetical protein
MSWRDVASVELSSCGAGARATGVLRVGMRYFGLRPGKEHVRLATLRYVSEERLLVRIDDFKYVTQKRLRLADGVKPRAGVPHPSICRRESSGVALFSPCSGTAVPRSRYGWMELLHWWDDGPMVRMQEAGRTPERGTISTRVNECDSLDAATTCGKAINSPGHGSAEEADDYRLDDPLKAAVLRPA